MRGFWPDERVEGGIWNLNKPIYRLVYNYFKRAEMKFIKRADHIISLTQNAKSEIQSWQTGLSEISVIPTCVDMDLFNPDKIDIAKAKELQNSLELGADDFLFIYVGSWGTWYLTDDILSFYKAAKDVIPEARLLILTPDKPDLGDLKSDPSISIKKATRLEVPTYLFLAQASICFVKPSFSKKASSATKMAESWAMNKRVITNSGWGDINWFTEQQCPFVEVIKESSATEFKNIALRLKQLPNSAEFRNDLIGKFDLKSGVLRYDEIYKKLLHA
jgi:glycosyltransferase involved in cell wall biosynthesis